MNNYTKEELCLIWLDSFIGLEYKHKEKLIELVEETPKIPTVVESAKDYLIGEVGENEYNTIKNSATKEYLDFILSEYDKKGVKIITKLSPDYPKEFEDITCPPICIYYKGNKNILSGNLFGIVGSRKSLPTSLNIAKNYTEQLSAAGFTLVTGIAEGVDGAVLRAALDCGGKMISIIAGGFDNIYPKQHAELVEKVAEKGLVISEYPPSVVPKPYLFPIRNRMIAGLSCGVLVVSGAIKSGTMYTAEYANDFGKDLFAVPYGIGVVSGAGCNELIKKGAMLTDTPSDILEFYGAEKKENIKPNLTEEEKSIVKVLSNGELHIEKICAALKRRVFEITPILSVLEIKGLVVKSGNVYALTRNDLEE